MVYVIVFLFGLLFGSFLNVCIYRLPRVHLSLHADSLRQLREKSLPPDLLRTLETLQDQVYVTEEDFFHALEQTLGEDMTAQYAAPILKATVSQRESIVFPASHCPHCDTPIKPWDNIPLFSFLLLRGKCRACRANISPRYPFIELLTAALFLAVISQFGLEPEAFIYLAFISALIVISFIDLDYQIIPDMISLPGIVIGILASFLLPLDWYESIAGALVGGGLILVTGYLGMLIFKKEAMGGGDVKLMAMVGAVLGWKFALLTIFLGSFTGAIAGLMFKYISGKEYIPFGPFLSLGAVLSLFFGQHLIFWYWNFILPPG